MVLVGCGYEECHAEEFLHFNTNTRQDIHSNAGFSSPFFETNWEVTATSNVAKTGLWSLVMISLVHPAKKKGKANSKGSCLWTFQKECNLILKLISVNPCIKQGEKAVSSNGWVQVPPATTASPCPKCASKYILSSHFDMQWRSKSGGPKRTFFWKWDGAIFPLLSTQLF